MAEAGGGAAAFSTRTAARILAVSPDRIRYWVKRNFIQPATPQSRKHRFAFGDLLVMRIAKEMLRARQHLDTVRDALNRVRNLAGPDRPVTALKLVNDEGRIVVRDGSALIDAHTGQLLFDFGGECRPGTIEERFGPARANARFEEMHRIAEADPLRALTLYSELAAREPGTFDTHLQMASILEREGDTSGALRHLLGAAAIMPASADVHLKLGLLYRKRSEHQHALRSFLRALECDPASVEAHCNAAEMYAALGRKQDARKHHRAIRGLIKGD
ncbi:MAG TPA: tetratricopeptide repeat protein [Candidatus Binataceae bacterium]|nr:tetratricopeptide repeat protein [Candidatus Binataceae bacterium]